MSIVVIIITLVHNVLLYMKLNGIIDIIHTQYHYTSYNRHMIIVNRGNIAIEGAWTLETGCGVTVGKATMDGGGGSHGSWWETGETVRKREREKGRKGEREKE